MGIADAYADGIEESLQRWAANPGPMPEPTFTGAAMMGIIPSAAREAAASFSEGMAAMERRSLATMEAQSRYSEGRGRPGIPAVRLERKREGAQMLQEMATTARRSAIDSLPDPMTTHVADQVIFGVGRFASKAVAAVGTLGPAGAILLGVEEGNTVSQTLMTEGVDPATAAKVGAVQGGLAAAGMVLPIAGRTIPQTIGLVGAGGPGAFMAQEAMSRKILQEAGYANQASLHNPFDPLGVSISLVLPGAAGALHMRAAPSLQRIVEHIESGGQRYGKDGKLLTSPKGAQGEMQVMPGTAKDPGFGVAPARDNSPEELARVGRDYLAAMQQRYGGDTDKALAAYNAGPGAVDAAVKEHGGQWLTAMPKETQEYVYKANALGARHAAQVAAQDPAAVDAARVAVLNDTVARSLPEAPDALAQMHRAADIVAESGGRAAEVELEPIRAVALAPDAPAVVRYMEDLRAIEERMVELRPHVDPRTGEDVSTIARDTPAFDEPRGIQAVAQAQAEEAAATSAFHEAAQAAAKAGSAVRRRAAPAQAAARAADRDYAGLRMQAAQWRTEIAKERYRVETGAPRPVRREAANALPDPDRVTAAVPAGRSTGAGAGAGDQPQLGAARGSEAASVARQQDLQDAQQLAIERPDLQVVLPGVEERMNIAEALSRIQAELAQDLQVANLVQAAAACARRG